MIAERVGATPSMQMGYATGPLPVFWAIEVRGCRVTDGSGRIRHQRDDLSGGIFIDADAQPGFTAGDEEFEGVAGGGSRLCD